MYKGKRTCKILKEIRAQIAAENDIAFVTSECKHQGDCAGTCPKCEAEVRYLEKELEKRIRLGKAVTVAGLAAAITATSISATSCDAFRPTGGEPTESYVDITDSRNVKLSTFTPNYVANLPKAARTLQLQEVMEIKDTKNSDRWRILTFWERYFICFEGNTDYYRLYHLADENVSATRKSHLLAVTYTAEGAVADVKVTKTEHHAQSVASPDLLPTYCADTILKNTFLSLEYPTSPSRIVLQEWWADCYLGAHKWIKNIDMFRMADGSLFWVYYDDQDKFSFSEYGAVEDYRQYGNWLIKVITPKIIKDEFYKRDIVAWLNQAFEDPREMFFRNWYSTYGGNTYWLRVADYFMYADSATVHYYSTSPITEEMRKNDAEVRAIVITYEDNGKIASIEPVRRVITASPSHAALLTLEEYLDITGNRTNLTQSLLYQIMEYSSLPAEEFSQQLLKLWEPYLQDHQTKVGWENKEITAYRYAVNRGTWQEEFWVTIDPETGLIKGFGDSDPFEPPIPDGAMMPDYEEIVDPWDVTPYDE